ncbi:helix-turn-helix transcriptional regulator [Phenylobacterium sp. LjRoot219]|uniref:AraC family transcriptional regulator n=1 Tax=Phenylobacterium sp. LjRoot219 TaxID=3342283 RepID=UPI003ECEB5DB
MRDVDPNEHDETPRPIVAVGNDYPPAFELAPHRHRRAQLLYAAQGVVSVSAIQGAWVAPPERAVWIPAGVEHAVKMVGAVSTRSVLITAESCPERGDCCEVLAVSPLLRRLLIESVDLPVEYDLAGRDGLLMALLAREIALAPTVPLAVPFPRSPALAAKCHAFLAAPDAGATIDDWACALGQGRRAFTRAFRRETGMSFQTWRQQAMLLAALPRLAEGEPVTTIALDLGYDSPAAFTTMFKRLTGIAPSRYRSS